MNYKTLVRNAFSCWLKVPIKNMCILNSLIFIIAHNKAELQRICDFLDNNRIHYFEHRFIGAAKEITVNYRDFIGKK